MPEITPSTKPKTIEEYLARVRPDQRRALEKLRRTIRAVAPQTTECISYGIPTFRLNGRSLVFFAAFAKHCSFFPGSVAMLRSFHDDLKKFHTSKGTIRFTPEKPLPVTLVKKLVKARMANIRG